MKKDTPTVSRKPAATVEQDKPAPSMRSALVLIFIILALITAIYILSTLSPGKINLPPNQFQEEKNWTLSPLIAQYGVTSVPVIVINCRYMRIGSDALNYGDEWERQKIGQALCAATNSSTFCSKFGRGSLTALNFPVCKKGNRNVIYAFHSPSCPISSEQRNVLDAFKDEFPQEVTVQYVCTPRGEQDMGSCAYGFSIGRYDQ